MGILYDAAQNHFLTTSIETPVVRFLDLPKKITPLRVSLPLRVLVMIAGPRNLKRLDAEGEWARLQDGLGDLLRSGQIVLERLPAATLSALRLRARGAPFHIFILSGMAVSISRGRRTACCNLRMRAGCRIRCAANCWGCSCTITGRCGWRC